MSCKIETQGVLKNDTIGVLMHALCVLYEEDGHMQSCRVNDSSEEATGNRLRNTSALRYYEVHIECY